MAIDVKSLSKEEKLRLLDLIQEKKRRELENKQKFKPHPGQMRVIESKALERYLFCGNGFGKSALLVNELHWSATGYNPITGEHYPVPAKICLVLDTPEKIDEIITEYRNWHPLPDKHLHKRGKSHYSAISYDNGSSIVVLTHDVSDLKPEGSQWTHAFFDEPPPRGLFIGLFRGGRIKGRPMKLLMAGTPVKAAWLRTEVWEPWKDGQLPYVECFSGDSDENAANLEEGWLERFSARLNEKEKRIRLKGEFFDLDGLALSHLFRPDTHLVEDAGIEEHKWPCVVVIDPHPSKEHNAIVLGVDKDDYLYVVDEFKQKAVAREFIRTLIYQKKWYSRFRVIDTVYDSLGSGDTTSGEGFKSFGAVINEELVKIGSRARSTTYEDKSDEEFIERIRESLVIPSEPNNFGEYVPKLRFYKHCKGCVDDIRTVQWYEDRTTKENKTKLDTRKKDFLSCIKYGLATNLFCDKPRRMQPHYRSDSPYGISLRDKSGAGTSRRYKLNTSFKKLLEQDDNDDF